MEFSTKQQTNFKNLLVKKSQGQNILLNNLNIPIFKNQTVPNEIFNNSFQNSNINQNSHENQLNHKSLFSERFGLAGNSYNQNPHSNNIDIEENNSYEVQQQFEEIEPQIRKKFRPQLDISRHRESFDSTFDYQSDSLTKNHDLSTELPSNNTENSYNKESGDYQSEISETHSNKTIKHENLLQRTNSNFLNSPSSSPQQIPSQQSIKRPKVINQVYFLTPDFKPLNKCKSSNDQINGSEDIMEEMHLDSETEDEKSALNTEIMKLINLKSGFLVFKPSSAKISNDLTKFKIKCFQKHSWETNLSELRKEKWCVKCANQMKKVQIYAESYQGICLSELLLQKVSFRCKKGHEWSISYRNWNKRWCSGCEKMKKKQMKDFFEQQEQMIQEENSKKQEELFKEAQRKMFQDQQPVLNNKHEEDIFTVQIIKAYRQIESEIQKLAEKRSTDYVKLTEDNTSQSQMLNIIAIYKMLLLPEDILKMYMSVLSEQELKLEFKKLALQLHPDKNNHPKAGIAFQKLNSFYSQALLKWNSSHSSFQDNDY